MEKLLGESFTKKDLTGIIQVEKVRSKTAATRVFARYPLKFMVPSKISPSSIDVTWFYAISYGGGIVSADCIRVSVCVGDLCNVVLTTQTSTKIFKAIGGQLTEQMLQADVGRGAFLAVLPDPITCFSGANYAQIQEFTLAADSSLLLVDWLTSGRLDNGESWAFEMYKSTNHIYVGGSIPVLLDSVCLEQGVCLSVADRMQGFHVIAMVVIYGPQLATLRKQMQSKVEALTNVAFNGRESRSLTAKLRDGSCALDPIIFASCSSVGNLDEGLVVRVVSSSTELVYEFLKGQLAAIAPLIGACPYAGR